MFLTMATVEFQSALAMMECHVHLQRVSGHVLDEILVPWCSDDGVVPLVRVKLSRVRLSFLLLSG